MILLDVAQENHAHIEACADILKCIAHPIRLSIIDLLGHEGPCNVTTIYKALDIEQAVASHHLGILKNKGVLSARREGKNTFYNLDKPEVLQVLECIQRCQLPV